MYNQVSSSTSVEKRRSPKCSLCVNHLGNAAPRTLGHKNKCEYETCKCRKCFITRTRRKGTAKEQQQRRGFEKKPFYEQEVPNKMNEFYQGAVEMYEEYRDPLLSIITKIFSICGGDKESAKDEFVNTLTTVANSYGVRFQRAVNEVQVEEVSSQADQNNNECKIFFATSSKFIKKFLFLQIKTLSNMILIQSI